MFFFLLLIIPAVTICSLTPEYKFSKIHFPALLGIFFALAATIAMEYFVTIEFLDAFSFKKNFLMLIPTSAIPPLFFTAFIFLLSKDTIEYKNAAVFCASGCFYSILVPYITIRSEDKSSFFMLFFNPILFSETIVLYRALQKTAISFFSRNKPISIGLVLASFAALGIQPVVKTLWQLKSMGILYIAVTILLIPAAYILNKISSNDTNSLDTNM